MTVITLSCLNLYHASHLQILNKLVELKSETQLQQLELDLNGGQPEELKFEKSRIQSLVSLKLKADTLYFADISKWMEKNPRLEILEIEEKYYARRFQRAEDKFHLQSFINLQSINLSGAVSEIILQNLPKLSHCTLKIHTRIREQQLTFHTAPGQTAEVVKLVIFKSKAHYGPFIKEMRLNALSVKSLIITLRLVCEVAYFKQLTYLEAHTDSPVLEKCPKVLTYIPLEYHAPDFLSFVKTIYSQLPTLTSLQLSGRPTNTLQMCAQILISVQQLRFLEIDGSMLFCERIIITPEESNLQEIRLMNHSKKVSIRVLCPRLKWLTLRFCDYKYLQISEIQTPYVIEFQSSRVDLSNCKNVGKLLIEDLQDKIELSQLPNLLLLQIKQSHYYEASLEKLMTLSPNLEELFLHFHPALLPISAQRIKVVHHNLKWITLLSGEDHFKKLKIDCPALKLLKLRQFNLEEGIECEHGRLSLEKVRLKGLDEHRVIQDQEQPLEDDQQISL